MKLATSIIVPGRFGENFDDEQGVQQRVQLLIEELLLSAGDNNVGIRVKT